MPTANPISAAHAALAIKKTMQVRREEYLDHMTFKANKRALADRAAYAEHLVSRPGDRAEHAHQGRRRDRPSDRPRLAAAGL